MTRKKITILLDERFFLATRTTLSANGVVISCGDVEGLIYIICKNRRESNIQNISDIYVLYAT